MMNVKLTIDGKPVQAKAGKTILETALEAGIYIPNLCYHPDLRPVGACRLCIVEIEGMKGLPTACTTVVQEGMIVHTNTEEIIKLRQNLVWLILSECPQVMEKDLQIKKIIEWTGTRELLPGYTPQSRNLAVSADEPLFVRDPNLCVLCDRCVRMCREVRGVGVIGVINRGIDCIVATSYGASMKDTACKFCCACVEVCPSGALADKEEFDEKDREKALLPCQNACPAGIDIPRYVRLIAEKRFQDAIAVICERVPFPFVLGCVCPHPCEDECRRCEVNEPIAIRELKRFVAEKDTGEWRTKMKVAPDTGKKVAVIGSGPAGLTCAWLLRRLGHTVTVYEALPEPGGMMRACIPRYRLPEDVLNREIKNIEDIGVEIKTGTRVESLDELFEHGTDAVFLALGAMKGMKMRIPGEDDSRVLDGISVLQSLNFGKDVDIRGTVAVVGGGNVAIDVARSCMRLGAGKVIILYRRTRKEMPASPEEIEYALEEGAEITFLVTPQKIVPETGNLKVECIRMELGEPDASGRRRPVPVEGSEFILEADRLIMAIGQQSVIPEGFNLTVDKRGRLQVNEETLACSRKGVFAGGDAVTGPATVVEAINAGRKAASGIDKYLGGSGEIDQQLVVPEEEDPWLGREEKFAERTRAKTPVLPLSKRLTGFHEVERTFDEETAAEEAGRCLRCRLRLNISAAPMPPGQKTGGK